MKFDNLNLGTNDVTLTTPERDLNATGRFLDDVEDLGVLGGAATGVVRGVAGAGEGVYSLLDFLSFDILPDAEDNFGLGRSRSMTGSAIEGLTQFGVGFVPGLGVASRLGKIGSIGLKVDKAIAVANKAGKLRKANALRFGKNFATGTTAGAMGDFLTFTHDEERLSNLLVQFPELRNPVTEYLAADEDDGVIEGRLKNVIEGGILGSAFEGVGAAIMSTRRAVFGLDGLKKIRKLKASGATPEQIQQALKNEGKIRNMRDTVGLGRDLSGQNREKAEVLLGIRHALFGENDDILFAGRQSFGGDGARGQIEFTDAGEQIIRGFKGADFSTGIHEMAHAARKVLFSRDAAGNAVDIRGVPKELIAYAETWAGALAKNGEVVWTRDAEEKWAEAFEMFILKGRAETPELRSVMLKAAQFMRSVYKGVDPSEVNVDNGMHEVFKAMLTRTDIPDEPLHALGKSQTLRQSGGFDDPWMDRYAQKLMSEGTIVNYTGRKSSDGSQMTPVLYRRLEEMGEIRKGQVNLDLGGGKHDLITDWYQMRGVKSYIHDPSRSAEHNKTVEALVRDGQVDTVTISNVLNVIAEKNVREQVLARAANAVKKDGSVYISTYKAKKKGASGGDKYQVAENLSFYKKEAEKFFDDVTIKKGVLIARKPKKNMRFGKKGITVLNQVRIADMEGFDSKLGNILRESKQKVMSPSQARAFFKKQGVKDEEMYWTGLSDIIDAAEKAGGKIDLTSDEIKPLTLKEYEYVPDLRMIGDPNDDAADVFPGYTVMEGDTVMGRRNMEDEALVDYEQPFERITAGTPGSTRIQVEDHADYYGTPKEIDADELADLIRDGSLLAVPDSGAALGRFGGPEPRITNPGGSNHRELLIQLPADRKLFENQHYPKVSNLLAHARMSDRYVPGQGKVLYIEEIQSDWHQAGRSKGYKSNEIDWAAALSEITVAAKEQARRKRSDAAFARFQEEPATESGLRLSDSLNKMALQENITAKVNGAIQATSRRLAEQIGNLEMDVVLKEKGIDAIFSDAAFRAGMRNLGERLRKAFPNHFVLSKDYPRDKFALADFVEEAMGRHVVYENGQLVIDLNQLAKEPVFSVLQGRTVAATDVLNDAMMEIFPNYMRGHRQQSFFFVSSMLDDLVESSRRPISLSSADRTMSMEEKIEGMLQSLKRGYPGATALDESLDARTAGGFVDPRLPFDIGRVANEGNSPFRSTPGIRKVNASTLHYSLIKEDQKRDLARALAFALDQYEQVKGPVRNATEFENKVLKNFLDSLFRTDHVVDMNPRVSSDYDNGLIRVDIDSTVDDAFESQLGRSILVTRDFRAEQELALFDESLERLGGLQGKLYAKGTVFMKDMGPVGAINPSKTIREQLSPAEQEELTEILHNLSRVAGLGTDLRYRTEGSVQSRMAEYLEGGAGAVENAPFKKTWQDLVLKRLVAKAAQEGYDGLAIPSGLDQTRRYHNPSMFQEYRLYDDENGERMFEIRDGEDKVIFTEPVKVGREVKDIEEHGISPTTAARLYDKAKAARFRNSEAGRLGSQELKEPDKPSGGMGLFYDKIVPKSLGKIVKKSGGVVEKQRMEFRGDENLTPNRTARPVVVDDATFVKLTPEVREKITGEPMSLFQSGRIPEGAVSPKGVKISGAIKRAQAGFPINRLRFSEIEDNEKALDAVIRSSDEDVLDNLLIRDTRTLDEVSDSAQTLSNQLSEFGTRPIDMDKLTSADQVRIAEIKLKATRDLTQQTVRITNQFADQADVGGIEDLVRFMMMADRADASIARVKEAQEAAGRILQSLKAQGRDVVPDRNLIPAELGDTLDEATARDLLTRLGQGDFEAGQKMARERLARYKAAREAQGPAGGLSHLAKTSSPMKMLTEYWMNSILSGPYTHLVNATSNTFNMFFLPFERALGKAMTGQISAASREIAMYKYIVQSIGDSFSAASTAFGREFDELDNIGKFDFSESGRAIGANSPLSKLTGNAVAEFVGKTLNLPSRFLLASDSFYKNLNYRAMVKAQLTEQALQNPTLVAGGSRAVADYVERSFESIVANGQAYTYANVRRRAVQEANSMYGEIADPTARSQARRDHMRRFMDENWSEERGELAKRSMQYAREATWTNSIKSNDRAALVRMAGGFQEIASKYPGLRFVIPFVRTPTNLVAFFADRAIGAPIDLMRFGFAKGQDMLVTKGEISKATQMLAKSGRTKEEIVGRTATGAGFMLLAHQAVMNGNLTGGGPSDRNQRRLWEETGWQPYSLKVGNRWYSYRRLDPFATFLGFIADVHEFDAQATAEERRASEGLAAAMVFSLARNVTNKTFLTGMTRIANVLSNPDRYAESYIEQTVASMLPFSSAAGQIVGESSMNVEIRSVMDAMRAKYGLTAQGDVPESMGGQNIVEPRRNLFGRETVRSKPWPWLPAIRYTEEDNNAVFNEMKRLGHGFSPPSRMILDMDMSSVRNKKGQSMYDRWLQNHGTVRIGRDNLEAALNRLITSRRYSRLPVETMSGLDSPRIREIQKIITKYRAEALDQTLREFPEFAQTYRNKLRMKANERRGVGGVPQLIEF